MAIHRGEELVLGGGLVALAAGLVFGQVGRYWLGSDDGVVGLVTEGRLWGLLAALLVLAFWTLRGRGRPTEVEVAPHDRRVRLLGTGSAWSLDELRSATCVDSRWSDAVRLDFGGQQLMVRAPAGSGERFAASIMAIVDDTDDSSR